MSKHPNRKNTELKEASPRRLTRERWLSASLAVLRDRGTPALTVDELTRELGVSKGSFYWHFENFTAFLKALAEYWKAEFTDRLIDSLAEQPADPEVRLRYISEMIIREQMARLDLQIRSLAITHLVVREVVESVDQARCATIGRIFQELGFTGETLKIRAHAFVTLHSLEGGLHAGPSDREKLAHIDERIRLFLE
jgi:AcrR family transcriptional regulator